MRKFKEKIVPNSEDNRNSLRHIGHGLMIEPTNDCNLNCPLCPSPNKMKRPTGYMEWELFCKIIDQAKDTITELDLWNFGEPFLHPKIFDMISYAERSGLRTRVSTNSTILGSTEINNIFKSGLSELIVCLDGATAETHQKYRVGSDFKQVLMGIRRLSEEKYNRGASLPVIRLNFITMAHNEHEVPAIVRLAERINVNRITLKNVSLGSHLPLISPQKISKTYLPKNPSFRKYELDSYEQPHIKNAVELCPWAEKPGVVLWNGDLTQCCYDPHGSYSLGNLNTKGLQGILKSPLAQKRREEIKNKDIDICRKCNFSLFPSISLKIDQGRVVFAGESKELIESPPPRKSEERCDVLIHSGHHVGIGHYLRMRRLAEIGQKQNLTIAWLLGNQEPMDFPVPKGVEVIRLPELPNSLQKPSVSNDIEYRHIQDIRLGLVLSHLARLHPRILVTETFPFGRYMLGLELLRMLLLAKRMNPPPKILCSLRDIPSLPNQVEQRRERLDDAICILKEFYDGITHHSDRHLMPFETSLGSLNLPVPLFQTGYIDKPLNGDKKTLPKSNQVLVAYAGGGAVGFDLFIAVIKLFKLNLLNGWSGKIIVGPNLDEEKWEDLQITSSGVSEIQLLRSTTDIRGILSKTTVVVCQVGYHAFLDIIACAVPAILVPCKASGDQERRAEILQNWGFGTVISENSLSPQKLAMSIDKALSLKPNPISINRLGGETTVQLWKELLCPAETP